MTKTVEAIFENGVFKPMGTIDIPEHERVTLVIEEKHEVPFDILSLATEVYSDLSPQDIEDMEKLITNRSNFSRNCR